jgi:hypothetical protein
MGRERMSIPAQIERQGNHGQQSGFDLPRMLDGSEGDVSMRSKPPIEHDFTGFVNVCRLPLPTRRRRIPSFSARGQPRVSRNVDPSALPAK